MDLDQRFMAVTAERRRLTTRFERRLKVLKVEFANARNHHLAGDIRDVANEAVLALTSFAEVLASEHVELIKARNGLTEDMRTKWLHFVDREMDTMYQACAFEVIDMSAEVAGNRTGVIRASIEFLDSQSLSYIYALEHKLSMENYTPDDANSLTERMVAAVGNLKGVRFQ